jgi:hypothetical protein
MTLEEIEKYILEAGSDDLGTFGGYFEGGIHCQQVPDELAPCILSILSTGKRINSYLEIGVAAGGTTFLIDYFFNPSVIVLVDDGKHHKAGFRPTILKNIEYHELIGRSDDEEIIKTARVFSSYDLIMIDGDHLYPGVKLDVVHYMPMLANRGFLVFHDSALPEWGVPRIVRELKENDDLEFVDEFVSKKHPKPLGLAVFRKKA